MNNKQKIRADELYAVARSSDDNQKFVRIFSKGDIPYIAAANAWKAGKAARATDK